MSANDSLPQEGSNGPAYRNITLHFPDEATCQEFVAKVATTARLSAIFVDALTDGKSPADVAEDCAMSAFNEVASAAWDSWNGEEL